MQTVDLDQLAYLTADEPGIAGKLKQRPEDFIVDEEPLYEPTGQGDHLYLFVEKRRRLTTDVARLFREHFGVKDVAVGYAGLKDKHAITRQWFSVEHASVERAAEFADEHIHILATDRHLNKLKRGHLRGNRFIIKLRDVELNDVVRVRRMLDRMCRCGVPNYLGEQRFGYRKNNHLLGQLLMLGKYREFLDEMLGRPIPADSPPAAEARQAYQTGDYVTALECWPKVHRFERQAIGPLSRGASPSQAVNGIDRPQLALLMSAYQSYIFNLVLDKRVRDGLFDTLLVGDLAFKHDSRGVFLVEDIAEAQQRCDAKLICPTGPMWGPDMIRAGGQVDQWELDALRSTDMDVSDLVASKRAPEGSRRPMRMLIDEPAVSAGGDELGPYIELRFMLPRGSFATTVMREIMKDGAPRDEET